MPSNNPTIGKRAEREGAAADLPPHVPPQPVTLSDALPERRMGLWGGMRLIDDLSPAKGIMLCLLLGMTLWGCIVAFCLR
jgi:hypothetical protein